MTSSPPQLSPSGTSDTFIEGDTRLYTPRNRRSIDSLCDIGPSLLLGQHSHFSSTIVPEHEGQAIVGCTSDALERRATLTLERATSGFTRDINGDPQAHDPPLLAPLDALAEAATLTRPPLRKSVDWRDIIGIGEDRRRDDQNGLLASRPEEKQGAKYSERVDRNITNNTRSRAPVILSQRYRGSEDSSAHTCPRQSPTRPVPGPTIPGSTYAHTHNLTYHPYRRPTLADLSVPVRNPRPRPSPDPLGQIMVQALIAEIPRPYEPLHVDIVDPHPRTISTIPFD